MAFDIRVPSANEIQRTAVRIIEDAVRSRNLGVSPVVTARVPATGPSPAQTSAIRAGIRGDFPAGTPPGVLPDAAVREIPGLPPRSFSARQVQEIVAVLVAAARRDASSRAAQRVSLPPERLDSTQAGGLGLRGFIAPNRRDPMVTDIEAALRPTQEMRHYQWDINFEGRTQAINAQQAIFSFVVPEDLAFEVLMLSGSISFAGSLVVTIVRDLSVIAQRVSEVAFAGGTSQKALLYASDGEKGDTTTSPRQDWLGYGKLDLWPGDTLTITSTSAPAAAHTATVQLRYRSRPIPKSVEISSRMTSAAV